MKPRSPNTTWLVLGAHTLLSCFIWFWVGLHYVHMLFPLPSQSPPAPAHQTTAMCLLQVSTLAHAQTHAPATQIHVGNWLLPRASLFQLCPSVSGISTYIGPSLNLKKKKKNTSLENSQSIAWSADVKKNRDSWGKATFLPSLNSFWIKGHQPNVPTDWNLCLCSS